MRVGILTQWYPPEPAQIPQTLAKGLRDRGHQVTVLTGFPNYPEGRIYPGYSQRLHQVADEGGITVHRVPLYPSHDRSAVRRVGNFLSFAASSTVLGARFLSGVDVVYVYHPPATAASLGLLKSLLGRTPFLLHIQDLWPDSVIEAGMVNRGMAVRAVESGLDALCNLLYRRSGAVVTISDGMRDVLIRRGVPAHKINRVYNWVDETLFYPRPRERKPGEPVTVLYAGNFGAYQQLEVALRAAALVDDADWQLCLVGSGTEESALRHLAADLRTANVAFRDRVPIRQAGEVAAEADAHLVSLADLPLFRVTIPSKTQAALATARPLVVAAPGEVSSLVERVGAGWRAAPGGVEDLAHAFRQVATAAESQRREMGQAGRGLYEEQMSEESGIDALESQLEQLSRGRSTRR